MVLVNFNDLIPKKRMASSLNQIMNKEISTQLKDVFSQLNEISSRQSQFVAKYDSDFEPGPDSDASSKLQPKPISNLSSLDDGIHSVEPNAPGTSGDQDDHNNSEAEVVAAAPSILRANVTDNKEFSLHPETSSQNLQMNSNGGQQQLQQTKKQKKTRTELSVTDDRSTKIFC